MHELFSITEQAQISLALGVCNYITGKGRGKRRQTDMLNGKGLRERKGIDEAILENRWDSGVGVCLQS